MNDWAGRPLDAVYAAVFIDAIVVKVRDGQVANRPVYAAIGVTVDGRKDVLGLWAGTGGEGAKFWMSVLVDLKNRGVTRRVLPRLRRAERTPRGGRAACGRRRSCRPASFHLIRNTFRLTSRSDCDAMKRDIKPIYTAPNPDAALDRAGRTRREMGQRSIRRWSGCGVTRGTSSSRSSTTTSRSGRMICSTNAIESLNARYRRAVRARGHFPTEQAAMKCLYLVTRSLDPTGTGRARWTMRWKPVINAFAITFGDRWPAAETY